MDIDTFRRNKNSPMPLSILYLAAYVSIYQKVFELGLKIYSLCLFWFAVAKMMTVTERQDIFYVKLINAMNILIWFTLTHA